MDNNGSNATLLSASDLCRAHLKSPDVPKPIFEEAESGPQGSRKAFSNSSSNRYCNPTLRHFCTLDGVIVSSEF